jgi:hypothetical protein
MLFQSHKDKDKQSLYSITRAEKGVEVQLYSFLASALDEGAWSTLYPGHNAPGIEAQYPLCRRMGGSQGQSGLVEGQKTSCPLELEPQTIQSRASHYLVA